jgi:hypothetical protein
VAVEELPFGPDFDGRVLFRLETCQGYGKSAVVSLGRIQLLADGIGGGRVRRMEGGNRQGFIDNAHIPIEEGILP